MNKKMPLLDKSGVKLNPEQIITAFNSLEGIRIFYICFSRMTCCNNLYLIIGASCLIIINEALI